MFSAYKSEVIKTYEKKKIEGTLPINLQHPTPAKLRDEWLLVIQENYTPQKDDALLRTFFGHKASINEYITCVKKLDPDKFRPLINFLKEKTKDTQQACHSKPKIFKKPKQPDAKKDKYFAI